MMVLWLAVVLAPLTLANEEVPAAFVPDYGPGAYGNPAGEARYVLGARVFVNDGDWEVSTLTGSHLQQTLQISLNLYMRDRIEPKGSTDGASELAQFYRPHGVALDEGRSLLAIADTNNNLIRLVDISTGLTSTLGSNHTDPGFVDGLPASFNRPRGTWFSADGAKIFVADSANHAIRVVDSYTGSTQTLAGSGSQGFANNEGRAAMFSYPSAVVEAQRGYPGTEVVEGTLFVADKGNHQIRRIVGRGVSTHCGGLTAGNRDGFRSEATFDSPAGLALHQSSGDLYVADAANHRIRVVTPHGLVTTVAGSTLGDRDSDSALASQFNFPCGIAVQQQASQPSVYFTDCGNSRVRALHRTGVQPKFYGVAAGQYRSSTVAGSGIPGWLDGQGNWSRMIRPTGLALHSNGKLFVADTENHVVRKLEQVGRPDELCSENSGECDQQRNCRDSRGVLCSDRQESCLDNDKCRCNVWYHDTQCVSMPTYRYRNQAAMRALDLKTTMLSLGFLSWVVCTCFSL